VVLVSATGVTVGGTYLLDGPEDSGGEFVTIKSLSSLTATLVRPVIRAHDTGCAFQSTDVTSAIAAISTAGIGYWLRIAYEVSTVDQDPIDWPLSVTRFTPTTRVTVESVRDLDPSLTKRFPEGIWFPAIVKRAFEMLIRRLGPRVPPGGVIGTVDLTEAHGYFIRELLAEIAGDPQEGYRKLMAERASEELDAALSNLKIDSDQDGVPNAHAGWFKSIPLRRG
jgi:hypothetical protein